MLDDGFFPLHSDELRKTQSLLFFFKHLSNWLTMLLKKPLTADAVETAVSVLQLSDAPRRRTHSLPRFGQVRRDTLVGSINFLETLSKECVREEP